jgi:hypothetical protein
MLKWREDLRRITHFFYRTIDQFEIRHAHVIAGYLQRGYDHFLDQFGGFAGVPIANQLAHARIERRINAPLSPRWLIVNCAPGEIFFHDQNVLAVVTACMFKDAGDRPSRRFTIVFCAKGATCSSPAWGNASGSMARKTCQRWKRDSPRAQFDPLASPEARFQRLFTWAI